MTVEEAVQLVVQAAAIGADGEVLVLDMGKPVRIADVPMGTESDTLVVSGVSVPAGWLRCKAKGSPKADDVLAIVTGYDVEQPLPFFVDRQLVRSAYELTTSEELDAEIRVLALQRTDETAVVEVLGDPVSFGPIVVVDIEALSA